jgi:hypothetical protein
VALQYAGLLALLAGMARAQAPIIGPQGDPSIRNDTIYGLALTAARARGLDQVYLLDDGVVRIEADGRGTRTYRQVVQVFSSELAENWATTGHQFGYAPSRERIRLNWARVVRPSGEVVDSMRYRPGDPAPDERSRDIAGFAFFLNGVEAGALVDWSYTRELLEPLIPGDYATTWYITTSAPVKRSRFIVDVPAALGPRLVERNLRAPHREEIVNGRRVFTWTSQDVAAHRPELFATYPEDGNAVVVAASGTVAWSDVARRFAPLFAAEPTGPAVDSALRRAVAGSRTAADSLRALHRSIARDIETVWRSRGSGSLPPRSPSEVVGGDSGTAADKVRLFVALAARLGVRVYPVLVRREGHVERALPSAEQLDHVLVAVERPGGDFALADLAALLPLGTLPIDRQGGFALLVQPDGRGDELTLPAAAPEANALTYQLVGEVDASGWLTGQMTHRRGGGFGDGLRELIGDSITAADRPYRARLIAAEMHRELRGREVVSAEGASLDRDPVIVLRVEWPRAVRREEEHDVLALPLFAYGADEPLDELAGAAPRRTPIDAAAILGSPATISHELRITLPPGWRVLLPPNISASSVFGTYEASYAQEGRTLRIARRMTAGSGRQPPERLADLVAWLRRIAEHEAAAFVLQR